MRVGQKKIKKGIYILEKIDDNLINGDGRRVETKRTNQLERTTKMTRIENIETKTLPELASIYNALCAGRDLPKVNRFSDKKAALRRIENLIASIEATEEAGVPVTIVEVELSDEAKATAEKFVAEIGTTPELTEAEEAAVRKVETLAGEIVETFSPAATVETFEVKTNSDGSVEVSQDGRPVNPIVNVDDAEITRPEPKAKRSKKSETPAEPRVTKQSLVRDAFEASGENGISKDELSAISGHDLKNVSICMAILKDAKRTKNPISFVYEKSTKRYFRQEIWEGFARNANASA